MAAGINFSQPLECKAHSKQGQQRQKEEKKKKLSQQNAILKCYSEWPLFY